MDVRESGIVSKVADYLAALTGMRLALLFGSVATGLARRDSDIDIAVLCDRPLDSTRYMTLITELARISGRTVDLVDLATAGVVVARSAVLHGRVLFRRNETAYPEQVTRVLLDSADFLSYRNRILRERGDAWLQKS